MSVPDWQRAARFPGGSGCRQTHLWKTPKQQKNACKSAFLRKTCVFGWDLFQPLNLAEKERFELSRRYSRPTPLAGAPLRPLEYFSKYSCEMPVAFSRRFLILYTFLPALSRAFCIFSCLPFKMFSDRLMPDGCTARNECRFHSYIDRSGLSRLKKGAFSNGISDIEAPIL